MRTLLIAAAVTLMATSSPAGEYDWPYWRGPNMNGISAEENLPDEWDPRGGEGSNLVWKREDLGSISTPIAMNGKIYLLANHNPGTDKEAEKVVCVDAETGETIWEQSFNVFLSDVPAERVAWSAVVGDPETGNVYALGVAGLFSCFRGDTGEIVWQHSLSEEYGLLSTYGGRTNYPIIHEDDVIISAVIIGWGETAKPAHRFIAFNKHNGQSTWFESTRLFPDDTTYSAPVLTALDGQAALVFGGGDGAYHAFQPRTGKEIWKYAASERGINLTPLVDDGRVFAGHSEENLDTTEMGAVFALDGTKTGEITEDGILWRKPGFFIGKSAPLLIDGRLYAIDDRAKLHIFDAESGEVLGEERLGTIMRSSPIYADGKIYVCENNGRFYIMKPTPDGVEIIHRLRLNQENAQGSMIVSAGRIYFPTTGALYCIGFPEPNVATHPVEPLPEEAPIGDNDQPAIARVVPVESLLYPSQTQRLQVRLYNDRGQWLRNADLSEVEFSVDGPGEISDEGVFSFSGDSGRHAGLTVTANVGEVSGQARIRVIPSLDWEFDFDDGQVPLTWVGARYRNIAIDFDLYEEVKKDDPTAADLYIYLKSSFDNTGAPQLVFDDTTPDLRYKGFLSFFWLDSDPERPQDLEEAKEKLDPSLQRLVDEKLIKSFEWSTWQRSEGSQEQPRLTVDKGDMAVTGNGVMCKIRTIPLGTRSQGWFGHPEFQNYTVQADVMGLERDGRLPDMGLIGQRYTIDLMGQSQQLQIRTWPPQLRMAQSVPFEWQGETWYTIKMQASLEDGQAVLRGKVWKRGEDEPSDWLLVAEDPIPNEHGSPGYYGNAKDSEIFYDNIRVYANDSSAAQGE